MEDKSDDMMLFIMLSLYGRQMTRWCLSCCHCMEDKSDDMMLSIMSLYGRQSDDTMLPIMLSLYGKQK